MRHRHRDAMEVGARGLGAKGLGATKSSDAMDVGARSLAKDSEAKGSHARESEAKESEAAEAAARRAVIAHLRDIAREHGRAKRWESVALPPGRGMAPRLALPLSHSPTGSFAALCADAAGPL